jgi:hypothetical protein
MGTGGDSAADVTDEEKDRCIFKPEQPLLTEASQITRGKEIVVL